jgi:hypothetical protein
MLLDILILTYVALIALLVWVSETLPQFSFRIILIGLFLSPIAGFISYYYYQRQK